MAKRKRDLETNRKIVIVTTTLLVIFVVIMAIMPAVLLYIENKNKQFMKQTDKEIEQYIIEIDAINKQIENNQNAIDEANDPIHYTNNIQETYPEKLVEYETYVKTDESKEKICYLIFEATSSANLDSILSTLSENSVLAVFFLTNETIEDSEKIMNDGHYIGTLIDNSVVNLKDKESYIKEFKDNYSSDLYLCQDDVTNEEIEKIFQDNNFKKVTYNTTSDDKPLLDANGYVNSIAETTADRDFITLKIDTSNKVVVNALDSLIKELKSKNYVFLPLVSSSTTLD